MFSTIQPKDVNIKNKIKKGIGSGGTNDDNESITNGFLEMLRRDVKEAYNTRNSFTNKWTRNQHFENNFLYRLIQCWKSYMYERLKDLDAEQGEDIWNFEREKPLLQNFKRFCIKNDEDYLPKNKFVFLYKFFTFCVEEYQITNVCFLIRNKECQDFFRNNIKKITTFFNENQVNKHNRKDVLNTVEDFCHKYLNLMISRFMFESYSL